MFTWLDVMLSEEVVKGLCNGIGSHLSPSAAHRASTVPGVWLKTPAALEGNGHVGSFLKCEHVFR